VESAKNELTIWQSQEMLAGRIAELDRMIGTLTRRIYYGRDDLPSEASAPLSKPRREGLAGALDARSDEVAALMDQVAQLLKLVGQHGEGPSANALVDQGFRDAAPKYSEGTAAPWRGTPDHRIR
jgi:hypothetical protein